MKTEKRVLNSIFVACCSALVLMLASCSSDFSTQSKTSEIIEMPMAQGGGGGTTANPVIAYENDYTVKRTQYLSIDVMNADGSNVTHLLTGGPQYPSWSHTGSDISYKQGNALKRLTVGIINNVPTAQNITTLYSWTSADSIDVLTQKWSSSASEIAFAKRQISASVSVSQRYCKIMVISSNGGTPTEIYSEQGTDIRGITWNPSGTQIAFCSGDLTTGVRTIKVIDRSSGSVTFSLQLDSTVFWAWNMNWSRTGLNKLAFRGNANGNGVNKLYTLDLDAQNPTPTLVGTPSGDTPTSPSWSPDNVKIMYFNQTSSIKTITMSNNATATVLSGGGGLNLDWKR